MRSESISRLARVLRHAMLPAALLALAGCSTRPASGAERRVTSPLSGARVRELYASARPLADFVSGMHDWRGEWSARIARATVPDSVAARLPRTAAQWHVIAVAEEGCQDSRNTMPFLARVVAALPNADLRFLNSTAGAAILATHRSPDGRSAVPTVLVVDSAYHEIACWVERPAPIQAWYLSHRDHVAPPAMHDSIGAWYARDHGRTAAREFVSFFDALATSAVPCAPAAPHPVLAVTRAAVP